MKKEQPERINKKTEGASKQEKSERKARAYSLDCDSVCCGYRRLEESCTYL